MTNKQALIKSYQLLTPFANGQKWEFESNLAHLKFITENVSKDDEIFDAGCGIGILAMALKLLGYRICGGDRYVFDPSSEFGIGEIEMLSDIWQKNNLSIKRFDVLADDWQKQYDVILSVAIIEHQLEPRLMLQKLKAGLKTGGMLYLATPNPTHLLNRIRFVFGRMPLGGLNNFFEQGKNFTGHFREYTLDELKYMLEKIGFETVLSKNIQDKKINWHEKTFRGWYVNIFRTLAHIVPGTGEADIVLARKK